MGDHIGAGDAPHHRAEQLGRIPREEGMHYDAVWRREPISTSRRAATMSVRPDQATSSTSTAWRPRSADAFGIEICTSRAPGRRFSHTRNGASASAATCATCRRRSCRDCRTRQPERERLSGQHSRSKRIGSNPPRPSNCGRQSFKVARRVSTGAERSPVSALREAPALLRR